MRAIDPPVALADTPLTSFWKARGIGQPRSHIGRGALLLPLAYAPRISLVAVWAGAPTRAPLGPSGAPVVVSAGADAESGGLPVLLEPFRLQGAADAGLIVVIQRDVTPILVSGSSTWPQVAALTVSAAIVLVVV